MASELHYLIVASSIEVRRFYRDRTHTAVESFMFETTRTKDDHALIYEFLIENCSFHYTKQGAIAASFTPAHQTEFILRFSEQLPFLCVQSTWKDASIVDEEWTKSSF